MKSKKSKNELAVVNTNALTTSQEKDSISEDEAFRQYQENEKHTKQAKRARKLLILFTILIYILGFSLFAILTVDIYKQWPIAGIIVGVLLLIIYSVCFFYIVSDIYSKPAFDLGFTKDRSNRFSERRNNEIRWEVANNIVNQAKAIDGLYTKKEDEQNSLAAIEELICSANGKAVSYKSKESQQLAVNLNMLMKKGGAVYQKANKIIWKNAVSCGVLTAVSQSEITDMGIIVIKNLQMIKDIVWLYGVRPTDAEMNRLMYKIIKAVGLSFGLNEAPKALVNSAAKALQNTSGAVGLLGTVLATGAQLVGNGIMTYMIGCQTVKAILKEYRLQDTFRQYVAASDSVNDYLMNNDDNTLVRLADEIKDAKKACKKNDSKAVEEIIDSNSGDDNKEGKSRKFPWFGKKKE